MFGQACEHIGHYPKALIGVAPLYCIDEMKIGLEKHHSHILLTPGKQWDQAIPSMRMVRKVIASKKPVIMLAVGGGNDTLKEMLAHAHDNVSIYVLRDGGRLSKGFLSKADDLHTPSTLHQQIQATRIVHL